MRTYVVEPQQIFVPSLIKLLQESGLSIVRVTNALDPLDVARIRPAMLFCDGDPLEEKTIRTLRFLHDSIPELQIVCLYSRAAPTDAGLRDCSRLVHLDKKAGGETLLATLQRYVTA